MPSCTTGAATIFIDEAYANQEIGKFISTKYPVFCAIVKKNDNAYQAYEASAFEDLLTTVSQTPDVTGLRVYLASYTSGQYVPAFQENLMTFIFAPTVARPGSGGQDHDDAGDYYITDPATGLFVNAGATIKNDWTNNYEDLKATQLPQPETRSLFYEKTFIDAFLAEFDCFRTQGNPITSVKVFLACFLDEAPVPDQITVTFNTTQQGSALAASTGKTSYNTGSPCPPLNCP